jgi:hypothetical protein
MNEAGWLVAEYNQRKRLAKLGFTSPLSELSVMKAEAFCMIDQEIDDLTSKEAKKAGKPHGR